MNRYPPLEARFWAKVDKGSPDKCWEWTAAKDKKGYGRFGIKRSTYFAHRISWQIFNGPIPEGICVLHRCDNPPCVNPAHLFSGTYADNNRDKAEKGRGFVPKPRARNGESNFSAELTADQAISIRQARGLITQRALASMYGISLAQVCRIQNNKSWSHVS